MMGKFKEKLYRIMYGRYGTDELYSFLTYLNIFLILADLIAVAFIEDEAIRSIVSLIFSITIMGLFALVIFRMMSRNIAKRRRENERYLKAWRAIKRLFSGNTSKGTKTFNRDDAYYIFRDCTKCGSTLRLSRREGRHRVKCPRCTHSFCVKAKKYKNK